MEAIKTRIYPNEVQKDFIEKTFGCTRFIYNKCLEQQIKNHEQEGKFVSKYGMIKWITKLKEEYDWLREVENTPLQKSVFNLESAYKKFFKEHRGFPKFKSKRSKQSYKTDQHIYVEGHWVKLPKMDKIRVFEKLPNINPRQIVISKEADKYYVSILFNNKRNKVKKTKKVGIDLGIKDFAIFSDGTKVSNPKLLSQSEKQLIKLQRRLSRCKEGSNRRKIAKLKVARCHQKIKNQRQDFLHKLTTAIAKQYKYVAIENLSVKNMVRNHCLAKSISDVAWGEFRRQLEYKMNWYGGELKVIGRFEPSSKTCSKCGLIKKDLKLSDREWICEKCGTKHDRDINAAKNILNFSYSPMERREGDVEICAIA